METICEVRHYEADDYATIKKWWIDHGADPMPKGMIPQSSVVITIEGEPAGFGSVFLCNSNHVGFFHGMVTRPGLRLGEAFAVLAAMQDGIDVIRQSGGHTHLLGTVRGDAMIRGAKKMGFSVSSGTLNQVERLVKPSTI